MKTWLLILLALLAIAGCSGGGSAEPPGAVDPATDGPTTVTLRGIITAAPYLAVDSSVNDLNAPFKSNRQFVEAQPIDNPVLLGGYVTHEATGAPGDTFEKNNDRFDTFLVTMAAGQRATMYVSDYLLNENEIDLLLRDPLRTNEHGLPLVVDSSLGSSEVLQVTAPEDGEYFLDVQAIKGASKYVIAVGSRPGLREMGYPEPLRAHLEMVPGEVIVTLRPEHFPDRLPGEGLPLMTPGRALAEELGMRKSGGGPGRENLLRLNAFRDTGAVLERLGLRSGAGLGPPAPAIRLTRDEPRQDAPPVLTAKPALLSFDAGGSPLDFTLQSIGGELRVVEITFAADWLTVSPLAVNDAGLGTYRVEVNGKSLLPGNYSAQVVATADSGATAAVTVTLRVPTTDALPPDAGVHYLLLLTKDFETISQVMVKAENGEYHFEMEVEPGAYYIVAGSDLDNDLLICTPGEACGAYPTADQPALITISKEQTEVDGIDFITTFGTSFSDSASLQTAHPFQLGLRRVSNDSDGPREGQNSGELLFHREVRP